MKIEKFEEIESWKLARELTKEIYRITKLNNFSKDFGLKDQIQRASVSIMANTCLQARFQKGSIAPQINLLLSF
jgi:four helix bundle protein